MARAAEGACQRVAKWAGAGHMVFPESAGLAVPTTPPAAPDADARPAPSTRPHRAASLHDHEAKRAFRGTHGVTWEDRRENRKEVNCEFESRPE